MAEVSALPQVRGDAVGPLLFGGCLLGRGQDLGLRDGKPARLIGRHGLRDP